MKMKTLLLVVVASLASTADINAAKTHYSNSWTVEVLGGPKEAEALAQKHGFVNKGQASVQEPPLITAEDVQIDNIIDELCDLLSYYELLVKTNFSEDLQFILRQNLMDACEWIGNLDNHYHFILNEETKIALPHISEALRNENHVGYVDQQTLKRFVKKGYIVPSDPKWARQWSLKNSGQTQGPSKLDLNVEPVWLQGFTGRGTVVAFVDDGLEKSHPDLKDNFDSYASHDFIDGDDDPTPDYTAIEPERHGTSCAGEVGMAKNSNCGIGVAYESKIAGLRVDVEYILESIVVDALSHEYNYVHIYSNSWGPADQGYQVEGLGKTEQLALRDGVTNGRNGKGSIYVWAAGNGGDYFDSCAADGYASSIYTIGVGSADQSGGQAFYDENCASKMAVTFSFNSDTWTSYPPNKQTSTTTIYGECVEDFTGTSASTPLVSGTIALALQANPDLTWRDVQYLIAYTSNPDILSGGTWTTNGGGLRVSHQFGFGAIDAEAIVTRARHWINVPEQQSAVIPSNESNDSEVEWFVYPHHPLNLTFEVNANHDIGSLEHVVITLSLDIQDYGTGFDVYDYFEELCEITPECHNEYSDKHYAVMNDWLQDQHPRRGDVMIELTSPNGTNSVLLPYRNYDFINEEGYDNWPFMSVHYWGENPVGTWNLSVTYRSSSGHVNTSGISLTIYGTKDIPEAVARIPSQCDSDCARGCADVGSQYCDVCKNYRIINATTLECVTSCPENYTEFGGYCVEGGVICTDNDTVLKGGYCIVPSNPTSNIAVLLGVFVPLSVLLVVVICLIAIAVYCFRRSSKRKSRARRLQTLIYDDEFNDSEDYVE